MIRSGRELTYTSGKDTGRYWDAGAANVHWVIATDAQVEEGIKNALRRVEASGVFIEGNSFTEFVAPDFFIMVARPDDLKIKPTARRALSRVSAVYVAGETDSGGACDRQRVGAFLLKSKPEADRDWPIFMRSQLPQLVRVLKGLNPQAAA